jgi:hypothetical protein
MKQKRKGYISIDQKIHCKTVMVWPAATYLILHTILLAWQTNI